MQGTDLKFLEFQFEVWSAFAQDRSDDEQTEPPFGKKLFGPSGCVARPWYEQVGSVSLIGWHSEIDTQPGNSGPALTQLSRPESSCVRSDIAREGDIHYETLVHRPAMTWKRIGDQRMP